MMEFICFKKIALISGVFFLSFVLSFVFIILFIIVLGKTNNFEKKDRLEIKGSTCILIILCALTISILYAFFEQFPYVEYLKAGFLGIALASFITITLYKKEAIIANCIFNFTINGLKPVIKTELEESVKMLGKPDK